MSHVTDQFELAQQYLAGGVIASTRFSKALGHPKHFDHARGSVQ